MTKVLLSDLTHDEVAVRLEGPSVAVIPVGSTEQHGHHLPLDVDTRIAFQLCADAAHAVAGEINVVVTPPFAFGISEHHMGFAGTLTVDAETFIAVVYQVGRSLVRHGFDRILIVNGHGGNVGALQIIASKLRLEANAHCVVYLSEWDLARDVFASLRESGPGGASHACEYETSLYLHLRPELVQLERASKVMPVPPIDGTAADLFTPGPYSVAFGRDFSDAGTLGDPTLASSTKGKEIYESAVRNLAYLLRQLAECD